ncbi:MAG: hypothetical protein ACREP9_21755 [Candidatus Dormibacteraceae bacterium]
MRKLHVARKWRWAAIGAVPVGAMVALSSTALAWCQPQGHVNCLGGNEANVGVYVVGDDFAQLKEGKLIVGHGDKTFGSTWTWDGDKNYTKSQRIALVDIKDDHDVDGVWNFALLTSEGKLLDSRNHKDGVFKVEIKGCNEHHRAPMPRPTPTPMPTPTPTTTPTPAPATNHPGLPATGLANLLG